MSRLNSVWVIWLGVIVFVGVAVYFAVQGYQQYGAENFGPNFKSDLFGSALGASLALITVLVGFKLEQQNRSRVLNAARYLFLRKEGENLNESYIRFVSTLRFTASTVSLAGKSWQAMKAEYWPDISTISEVQSSINTGILTGTYDYSTIRAAYNALQLSVENVVLMSATAIFEGKENIFKSTLWNADFKVHVLSSRLLSLACRTELDSDVDLMPIQTEIKEAALSSGELLKSLCKLAKGVKLQ